MADDPTPQDKARDSIFTSISEAQPGTPEDIGKLADAYSAVAYGPQGGALGTDYRYTADYHDTKHEGEKREKPAGFG